MHKYITIIFILLFNYKAFAVDLHSALSSAYDNNDKWQTLRRQFLIDIETFSEAFSEFLPQAYINMQDQDGKTKYNTSQTNIINNNLPNNKSLHNQQGSFVISQNIFSGGGSMARIKAAQEYFKALRAQYYADEQKLILELIENYLYCYSTKEKYEISEEHVKIIQEQLTSSEEKLKLGEATTIDLATAKANLALAETDRLTKYADYQWAKAYFLKDFGIVADNIILPSIPDNLPSSLESMTQRAILVNPNVDYARYNVSQGKALELAAKSALLPTVDLKLEKGKSFYDPQNLSNGFNNKSTTSSVSVNIPIYSKGAEYSRIRKSKNSTRLAVISLDDAIRIVRAESISAWVYYEAAKSKIIAATQGVEAAQLSYDGNVQGEIVGAKTILDVLDATDDLNETKVQKVDAYTESIGSAYAIKALVGELTAKSLKLKVKYFIPEDAFKTLKKKLFIGF